MTFRLEDLDAIVRARLASGNPETSHTARLAARGRNKCAQKFGEEAVETVIAAVGEDRAALVAETADALYHLLVLLAVADVPYDDVVRELERRTARSGLEEKASRGPRT